MFEIICIGLVFTNLLYNLQKTSACLFLDKVFLVKSAVAKQMIRKINSVTTNTNSSKKRQKKTTRYLLIKYLGIIALNAIMTRKIIRREVEPILPKQSMDSHINSAAAGAADYRAENEILC